MSLPGKTMKIGGYNYHVSDQGKGDKVAFLVHGMPDDGSCWKYQAPALLKAGYRVIVPDTLGYGRTDRPVEVEHYKVEKIIDHMFEIIDTLGLKDIHLMGHDWGSAITWPMVLQRPELFRKFISMSVGHMRCFVGQAFENYKRAVPAVVDNWYMYIHTQTATEELFLLNDMDFLAGSSSVTHPEEEAIATPSRRPAASSGSTTTRPTTSLRCTSITRRTPTVPELQGPDHGDVPRAGHVPVEGAGDRHAEVHGRRVPCQDHPGRALGHAGPSRTTSTS